MDNPNQLPPTLQRKIGDDAANHSAALELPCDVMRARLRIAAELADRQPPGIVVLDHARPGAVEADETKPTKNTFGTEMRGEKFFAAQPVLKSEDHRLFA